MKTKVTTNKHVGQKKTLTEKNKADQVRSDGKYIYPTGAQNYKYPISINSFNEGE